jgi:hypothetical protein
LVDAENEILARIRESFISRRWRDVTSIRAETPDVVILTAALERSHEGVAYGDGGPRVSAWLGGRMDRLGLEAGVTFTYESGTLLIVMLDRHHDNTPRSAFQCSGLPERGTYDTRLKHRRGHRGHR